MREKFAAPRVSPNMEVVENKVRDQSGRIGEAAAPKPASPENSDPLVRALDGLCPDRGLKAAPAAVPLIPVAGPDDLDLGDLESDGQDWSGFSVDQGFSEDATMVASAADIFGREVTVPATGQVLTRRDLLADLLGVIVANLKANKVLFGPDRLRQQDQVQKLVKAMMNSMASGEAMAEDTVKLLLGAMGAAGRGPRREPGPDRRG